MLLTLCAGLTGLVLALAVPFLPVQQTTAHLAWPQGGVVDSVTAPLTAYAPTDLDVSVPCSALGRPGGAAGERTVLATAPSGTEGARQRALQITADAGAVTVRSAGEVLARAPANAVGSGACTAIRVHATAEKTSASFLGLDSPSASSTVTERDLRPQVVGVFTDLTGPAQPGLSLHATVDTRYQATPTLAKWLAMGFALGLIAVSLAALARLDGAARGRLQRSLRGRAASLIPRRWRYVSAADATVIVVLLIWQVIGANTSDDGYELGMARAAGHAGYMPNYFRWFGAPEAPFGYPYYVFTALSHVSPSSVVLRLPALIAAIVCWLVVSRGILPRFAACAGRNSAALWTAALVLLAFWLPYNNGLRPEPYIAAGVVITWACVERAIAQGRILPFGIALFVAGVTLTGGPTATICAAPVLAGAPRLLRLLRRRARELGGPWAFPALIIPLLASAAVFVAIAFSRASIGPVLAATRMKGEVGPSNPWYAEYRRYAMLFEDSPDGSIARRFAVAVMLLAVVVCLVLLARRSRGRRWRLRGLAAGPSRRTVAVVVLALALMTLNPTKWTHHFGAFAALGSAAAALAVLAVRNRSASSLRGRRLVAAGVLLVLAVSFASANSWWYVSDYGVPNGRWVTVACWVFAAACLAAAGVLLVRARWRSPGAARWPAGAPVPGAAAAVVALEVASMTIAVAVQYPGYSVGLANARALSGHPCNLADSVLVEGDPNAALLSPATPTRDPLGAGGRIGFDPDGLPVDIDDRPDDNGGLVGKPAQAPPRNPPGTGGGLRAEPGVNGSHAALPFGLDPASTPVLGSYAADDPGAVAVAVSTWYLLPPRARDRPLLSIAAAGQVKRENFQVQFGEWTADGFSIVGHSGLEDVGPAPSWRNLRLPMSDVPDGAQAVRIVTHDVDPDPEEWIAFTPPRVPTLRTLQDVVGSDAPTLMDWPVPLTMTCQHLPEYIDGVAEVPRYRIQAERGLAVVATNWQSAQGGGPLGRTGLLLRSETMPTYLDHDWGRQWGELVRYTPRAADAAAADLDVGTRERSGLWTPGPIKDQW